MVKVGDMIKATGLGSFFVGLIEGSSGQGRVVHVGNPEGTVTDPEVLEMDLDPTHLTSGIIYRDTGMNDLMWLADGDFEVIEVVEE